MVLEGRTRELPQCLEDGHAYYGTQTFNQSLVQLVREGRDDAAGVIWDRYAPMVRRVIRRTLAAGSETEDLVQEVFLRFVDMLPRLRDPQALPAFLYGIASRYAVSELRRRQVRRMVRLSDSGTPPDVPVAPAQHDVREVVTALYRVLERLRPRERVVFVLHDVEGLEFSEVAAALRVSESTAKRAAASGRQRVARLAI